MRQSSAANTEFLPFAFLISGFDTEDDYDREQNLRLVKESDFLLFEINRYKDYVGSGFFPTESVILTFWLSP